MAMIPYTLLTQGLYSGIITGIGKMTFGIAGVIKTIYRYQNPNINKYIQTLDIEYHINLISSVLRKYSKLGSINIKEHIGDKSVIFTTIPIKTITNDPMQISLKYLSQSIEDIHKDLLCIMEDISYHQLKWFNSWRSLNIKKRLDTLEIHNNILKSRYNNFIQIYSAFESNK